METYTGNIKMIVREHPDYANPSKAVLGAEVYLNGDVSIEIFKRYGIALRVHMNESEVQRD